MYKNIVFDIGGVLINFNPRDFLMDLFFNEDVEDRRLLHAVGDGTFFADGEKINLREDMRAKLPPLL